MRILLYSVSSLALAGAVLVSALLETRHLLLASIKIAKSSASVLILLNLLLFLVLMIGKGFQTLFFGQLRAIEVEHLFERAWFAITETGLALTIFRDEFTLFFAFLFGALLFIKVFHWLASDRIDFMEQSTNISTGFHIQMSFALFLLLLADCVLVWTSWNALKPNAPNMLLIFVFEGVILLFSLLGAFAKYLLHSIDLHRQEVWEQKSIYIFFTELVIGNFDFKFYWADFFKLVTYAAFFAVLLKFYGIPLHIVRDLYITVRSFMKKCRDLIHYQRAAYNLYHLYETPTQEMLDAGDKTCIICREEMTAVQNIAPVEPVRGWFGLLFPRAGTMNPLTPKKLPCGHVFHFRCLRSWLERQQTCPTCRMDITRELPTQPVVPPVTQPPLPPNIPPGPSVSLPNISHSIPMSTQPRESTEALPDQVMAYPLVPVDFSSLDLDSLSKDPKTKDQLHALLNQLLENQAKIIHTMSQLLNE